MNDLTPIPVGNDIQVNTWAEGLQRNPALTPLADGGFVVTWTSLSQDDNTWDIHGQRYAANGVAVGSEFRVNTSASGDQVDAVVTALAGGGFVVAWTSNGQDGTGPGILGQRFDDNGATSGTEFLVSSNVTNNKAALSISALGDGGFVVTWSSGEVYGRRFDSSGAASASEFRINTESAATAPATTSVAALAEGGFVAVWSSFGPDGFGSGVFGQRYDAIGTAVGGEFQINTYWIGAQKGPSVTALTDGGFVVVWEGSDQDASGYGIFGQRFNSGGTPIGPEFRANTLEATDQLHPSVTALRDGGFVVTWSSASNVFGQRFDASGTAIGSEFQLNQTSAVDPSAYGATRIIELEDGTLVQGWHTAEVLIRLLEIPGPNLPPIIVSNNGGDTASISVAENTALVTTVTADDADAGQTLTYSIAGGADVALFTIDSTSGALSFITPPNFEAPADAGANSSYEVTVQVDDGAGGTDTQAISVTVTNVNELPVVTGVATGAVTEDGGAGATAAGQLSASDPDANTDLTWSIDGGSITGGADYRFALDNLTVTRTAGANTVTILNDTFEDGNPPPAIAGTLAPPNNVTYGVNGSFTEEGGRAIIDATGAAQIAGIGTPDPFVGQGMTVLTSADPVGTGGLRSSTSFTVEGRFDLTLPNDPREAYGIRLGDRTAALAGDDVVEIIVRKGVDGNVRVQLRDVDYVNDTTTVLGSMLLEPPEGTTQIILRLAHSASNVGVVTASLTYLGGTSPVTHVLEATGRIFGTGTSGTGDDETWTRASVIAFAPEITDSALAGVYGTLNINQAGQWTYTLANSHASVQALAAGQVVNDTFTVLASDGAGGVTPQAISVAVTGTNDAPTVANAVADQAAEEGEPFSLVLPANAFADVDAGDTLTLAATLLGGGPLPGWLQFNPAIGTFSGTPGAGDAGFYTVVVRATDQSGASASETFTLSVETAPVNTAPSFAVGDGIVTTPIGPGNDAGMDAVLQPDGKVIVAGISSNGANDDFALVRYNVDGSLDAGFGVGGRLTTAFGTGTDAAFKLVLQANGKIVVGGTSTIDNRREFAVVRYDEDGTIDTSFGAGGRFATTFASDSAVQALALQADGKILLAGYSATPPTVGDYRFTLIRLDQNGALDTSFSGDGVAFAPFNISGVRALAVQTDGKIVAGGFGIVAGNLNDFALARFNADGSLDSAFGTGGMVTTAVSAGALTDAIQSIALTVDGKILVAGYTGSNFSGTLPNDIALARYNADGSLDTTFSGDGLLRTAIGAGEDFASSVKLLPDGKILVAGQSSNGSNNDILVVRYNADGSLDTSFSGDGMLVTPIGAGNDAGTSLIVLPDGRFVVAGYTRNGTTDDFALIRYNADGTLDTTFDSVNTLNGAPAYVENAPAIVLDSTVAVFDAQLAALNGGLGNYGSSTLTITRASGANADDVFSVSAPSSLGVGAQILPGGAAVTVTQNAGGVLALTFANGTTQTQINAALSAIRYANSSDAPPLSVTLNWMLGDGNTGAQGTGGALAATGSITIAITAANDAPVITTAGGTQTEPAFSAAENFTGVVATLAGTDPDLNNPALTWSLGPNGTALYDNEAFAIDPITGVLSLVAPQDFETGGVGGDNLLRAQVILSDGTASNTRDVFVRVTDVVEVPPNTAPVISSPAAVSIVENTMAVSTVTVDDPDPEQTHSYTIVGGADAAKFQINAETGALSFVAPPNFERPQDVDGDNTYHVTVRAEDGEGGTDTQAIAVTVADDPAEAPTLPLTVFAASDPVTGNELWISDGTSAGTVLLKNISPGGSGSQPRNFHAFGDKIVFEAATPEHGAELWVTDGTTAGTHLLADVVPGADASSPREFIEVGGTLFFTTVTVSGHGLWSTDGTAEGTAFLMDLGSGATFQSASLSGKLIFAATDAQHGTELWSSDGTVAGTRLLKDINLSSFGAEGSSPREFIVLGNKVLFQADNGSSGPELWATDGTTEGTVLIADVYNIGNGGSGPQLLTRLGDKVVFSAIGPFVANELWVTDGTTEGTILLKDIWPGAGGASQPSQFTVLGDLLIFTATDNLNGTELWVTDGTSAGTVLLKDINPGLGHGQATFFTAFDGKMVFQANDGTNGAELWVTDGTPAGTRLLKDINPSGSSQPAAFAALGEKVVFTATTVEHGTELWVTDGTADGTILLADVVAGAGSSMPAGLRVVGGNVMFTVTLPGGSQQLWTTDGTPAGTQVIPGVTAPQTAGAGVFELPDHAPTVSSTIADQIATEGSPFSLTLAAGTFADADAGDRPVLSATGLPQWLVFEAATGTFAGTPSFTDAGSFDITVTATDRAGVPVSDTFTLTVNDAVPTNTPPELGPATTIATVAENTTLVRVLDAADPDAGQTLLYEVVGGADAGLFEIRGGNALHFKIAPDFENPSDAGGNNIYDVTVRASDGAGGTDEQALAVGVTNVAEATRPSAGGPYTITQGQPLTLDATGTVPDTGVSIVSYQWLFDGSPIATGATPTIPWSTLSTIGAGPHTFTVRVLDSTGQTTTDSESILLTGFNPIITTNGGGATASVPVVENTTSVTTVAALEPNGDTVTYSIVGGADAARFQINASTGLLSFIAAPNFEVPADAGANNVYDVTVQASDGLGGIDTQAIAVSVTNTNEAPTAVADSIGNIPAGFVVNPGNGHFYRYVTSQLTWDQAATAASVAGGYLATITSAQENAFVKSLLSSSFAFNWLGANDRTTEGTWQWTQGPEAGTTFWVGLQNGNAVAGRYTNWLANEPNQAGGEEDFLSMLFSGQWNDWGAQPGSIAPYVIEIGGRAQDGILTEDAAVNINVLANDTDPDAGDTLTVAAHDATSALGAAISAGPNGTLRYDPTASSQVQALAGGQIATDAFTYTVRDTGGLTSSATVTVRLVGLNDAPTVNQIADQSADAGAAYSFTLPAGTFADVDAGDTLTLTATLAGGAALPSWLQFNAATGTFSGSPQAGDIGTYQVTVTATDALGASVSDTFTLAIDDPTPSNTAPELGPATDAASVAENTTLVRVLAAVDPDAGQVLIYEVVGGADAGLFEIRGSNELHFKAAPDFEAPGDAGANNVYDVTVRVSDGAGGTDEQAIAVSVTDVEGAIIIGTPGNDAGVAALIGTPENDVIVGRGGDDEIRAGDGDDIITVGSGQILLEGGDGNDLFRFGDNSSIAVRGAIHGGNGNDTIIVNSGQSVDFRAIGNGFTSIETLSNGGGVGRFDASQLLGGIGQLPTDLQVNGNGLAGGFEIFGAQKLSLAGWIVSGQVRVLVRMTEGLGNSFTGSDAVDEIYSSSSDDTVDGGGADDIAFYSGNLVDYRITGSPGALTIADLREGSPDGTDTVINVEWLAFANGTFTTEEILDQFDVTTPVDANDGANAVTENAAAGTLVGITAQAADADPAATVSYTLTSNPGGLFAIDAATGVVTVAGAIDREALGPTVDIEVTATSSDGSSAASTFTIAIGDVDEFDVSTPVDVDGSAGGSVAENAASGTVVGITAFASDADATNNGLSYSLSDNAGGRFAIDAATGVVTVANGSLLDFETAQSHQIEVLATSADGSTASQTFAVAVTDVADTAAMAIDKSVAGIVDADGGDGGATVDEVGDRITYSIAVRNTGDVALTGVTVSDPMLANLAYAGGDADGDSALDVGEVWTYMGGYAVTQDDLDNNGTFNNRFSPDAMEIRVVDTHRLMFVSLGIDAAGRLTNDPAQIVKVIATSGHQAAMDVIAVAFEVFGTVQTPEASDPGNQAILHLTTVELQAAINWMLNGGNGPSPLLPLLTDFGGVIHNVASADSDQTGSVSDDASVSVVQNKALALDKVADVVSVDSAGDLITYTYTLTNAGNAAVSGIVLSDDNATPGEAGDDFSPERIGGDSDGDERLDVGETWVYRATRTVSAAQIAAGLAITSAAVASGVGAQSSVDSTSVGVDSGNGAPSDIALAGTTVVENAANGTLIGTLSGTDPDGDALVLTLDDDAGGRFRIANGNQLVVNNGALLDYEAAQSYAITVLATDAGGLSYAETFAITLQNVGGITQSGNGSANTITGAGEEDTLFGNGGNDTLRGLGGNDTLDGGAGNDLLDGGTGADSMAGGTGNDTYEVDNAGDVVTEAANAGTDLVRTTLAAYTLPGNVENLTFTGTGGFAGTGNDAANTLTGGAGDDGLFGLAGNDTLVGGAGNDLLDGGTGSDAMTGGAGNDTYVVDATGDSVNESSSGGVDTVQTALSNYTLGSNVENLTLTGTGNISGTGNALANLLTGNAGNNTLSGGSGNDTLISGAGNDTLDGGSGADSMAGGTGDDTYVVDNAGDSVGEAENEGTDTVQTSFNGYVLAANVENLTLTGGSGISGTGNDLANVLTGNGGNNTLRGLGGNDTLNGGGGNDTLDGGTGDDTMAGGSGNDTYEVDSTGDVVTESAGGGTDLVRTILAAYTLGTNVENLTFTGTGNFAGTGSSASNAITGGAGDDVLFGLAGNDTLVGGAGNDLLDGGTGTDTMAGGIGDDIYVVGSSGDEVVESANQGIDTVLATVASYGLDANIENLTYIGSGSFDGTGNGLANVITGAGGNDELGGGGGDDTLIGNGGNDALSGDSGNDRLEGGAGNDLLTGGSGADTFVFKPGFGNDRITDFDANAVGGQDFIDITAFGITTAQQFQNRVAITDIGAHTLVTIDGDPAQTIRLDGIGNATTVTVDDFRFL